MGDEIETGNSDSNSNSNGLVRHVFVAVHIVSLLRVVVAAWMGRPTHPAYRLLRRSTDVRVTSSGSVTDCDDALLWLLEDRPAALGVDAEWRPRHGSHVALVQLSSGPRTLLLRLQPPGGPVPEGLRTLFNSPSVAKVGVGVAHDVARLGCGGRSLVDLNRLAGTHHESLQKLCARFLGVDLPKDRSITCGDWEARSLSPAQVDYAAADAFFSVRLLLMMLGSAGPAPLRHETARRMAETHGVTVPPRDPLRRGLADRDRDPGRPRERERRRHGSPPSEENAQQQEHAQHRPPAAAERPPHDTVFRRRPRAPTSTRRLYENHRLLAPGGELLCTCDSKKTAWYLGRGLAEQVEPGVVRLLFQPAKVVADPYNTEAHRNICVVCGTDDVSVLRHHHVVPSMYRRHMHEDLKSHCSHDVLIMCGGCKVQADHHSQELRKILLAGIGQQGAGAGGVLAEGQREVRAKRAASALLRRGGVIPAARRDELAEIVRLWAGPDRDPLHPAVLEAAASLPAPGAHAEVPDDGRAVVERLDLAGQRELCIRWRRHFVETSRPRHLSAGWSIDYNHLET